MNTRAIAIGLAAIMAFAVLMPAVSDDSEAATTERVSIFYVYEAEFTYTGSVSGPNYWFVAGSENHNKFLQYLSDPLNNSYDGSWNENASFGDTCYAYDITPYTTDTFYLNGDYVDAKLVLSPYGDAKFSVVSGNTLTVTLNSATNNRGYSVDCGLFVTGSLYSMIVELTPGQEVSYKSASTATYIIWAEQPYAALYIEMSYTASGQTEPNGSATVFAAVCFVFTAIAVGLVAVASVKPRWAK